MKIGIVFNSKSGRGKAAAMMPSLMDGLYADGHELTVADVAASRDASRIAADAADVLLIAGGDGSVHHALDAAAENQAAIYHIPLGTENLFARQFGMKRDVTHVRRAVSAGHTSAVDLGRTQRDGHVTDFAIMLSFGLDASIIHRLDKDRRGPISHLSYTRPILLEVLEPTLRPLTIHADGKPIVTNEAGMLVIANSRQYAVRLDPATRASMDDGKLDVVFFPTETILGAMRWYAASWLRDHLDDPGVRYVHAAQIEIEAGSAPSQLDGEAWHMATGHVSVHAEPQRLRVLLPAK
jgi:diacylglycerol kinase (ATP)